MWRREATRTDKRSHLLNDSPGFIAVIAIGALLFGGCGDKISTNVDLSLCLKSTVRPLDEVGDKEGKKESTCGGITQRVHVTTSSNTEYIISAAPAVWPGQLVSLDSALGYPREIRKERFEAAFDAVFSGKGSVEDYKLLDGSEIEAILYGGNTDPVPRLLKIDELLTIFSDGARWSPAANPGVPIAYVVSHFDAGLRPVAFGRTTEFVLEKVDPKQGDTLWLIESIGRDFQHDNIPVDRHGVPWCLAVLDCWASPRFAGGSHGPGSLDVVVEQDFAVRASTWVYAKDATVFQLPVSGTVPRLWVNDNEFAVVGGQATVALPQGWSHLQLTDGRQHGTARLTIPTDLSLFVDAINSSACVIE